jgi:phosphatidylglycerophosphatase A
MFGMIMNLKELCLKISSCGPLGTMRGGGLIASLGAVPFLMITCALSVMSPYIGHLFAGVFLAVALIAVFIALNIQEPKDLSVIVIDKTVGMALAFCCIPVSLKLFVVGFILFHVANIILPMFLMKTWKFDLDALPSIAGVFSGDLLAGAVVQLTFRLILWLAN